MTALSDQHTFVAIADDSELEVGDLVGLGISHPCTTFDRWPLMMLVDDDYTVVERDRDLALRPDAARARQPRHSLDGRLPTSLRQRKTEPDKGNAASWCAIEVLASRGDVEVAEVGAAEGNARRVRCRNLHLGDDLAGRRQPDDAAATPERDPHVSGRVDRQTVRAAGDGGCIEERLARVQLSTRRRCRVRCPAQVIVPGPLSTYRCRPSIGDQSMPLEMLTPSSTGTTCDRIDPKQRPRLAPGVAQRAGPQRAIRCDRAVVEADVVGESAARRRSRAS